MDSDSIINNIAYYQSQESKSIEEYDQSNPHILPRAKQIFRILDIKGFDSVHNIV